jgi:hypothetical protein
MPKKIVLKNDKKTRSVASFVKSLPPDMRQDAKALLHVFKKATGAKPRMWGNDMIGFGEYEYQRSNGDYGNYFATGFALRKSGPTVYIMPGYTDYSHILEKLGPHKLGKSCLYLKSLNGVDMGVVKKLIEIGLKDLKRNYKVTMK